MNYKDIKTASQPVNYIGLTQKTFSQAKFEFDNNYSNIKDFTGFISEHLTHNPKSILKKTNDTPNEQYYKWQFLYAIVHSGLVPKDYIGTEIHFPKGNKSSAALKIDAAIFQ